MNRAYVRKRALFGKTRPRKSVGLTDYWGSRKTIKRIQVYFKPQIKSVRVEFDLRPRFLRHFEVEDPYDFHKLAQLLPRRHVLFARVDEQKLLRQLKNMGFSSGEIQAIKKEVRCRDHDLWATLKYLRSIGMKNVRRVLCFLRLNALIQEALAEWASQWPRSPRRLQTEKQCTNFGM